MSSGNDNHVGCGIHNHQKKIAIINDMSGFGKCSIAVALPIISHMKIQGCPLPTAVFSNHTGFESFYYRDFTADMESYIAEWKKLGLYFDGIASGFLGSHAQIDIVERFISDFADEDTKIIIDPVMGEDGHPYPTYTREMCESMRRLAAHGKILTPNVTEACMLTGTEYKYSGWKLKELEKMTDELREIGSENVVITGIHTGEYIANAVYDTESGFSVVRQKKAGTFRSGTGDIFAAVIAADAVNGLNFTESVRKASHFVKSCVAETEKLNIPLTDGVCFENLLYKLK